MAEIHEMLQNNSQLSKLLHELIFNQKATSAILTASDKDGVASNSLLKNEKAAVCKSVPVTQGSQSLKKTISGDDRGTTQLANGIKTVVDSSLGRPRYQWSEPENAEQGSQHAALNPKELYSVYVGHLPGDITQGELNDLFSDVGEVVDSFVSPMSSGHTYTFGFVRFHTLEEANAAVKEKKLKVIGKRKINVELSSTTRRKLSDNEDGTPLLRKDYPKVVRQPQTESNEKQLIGKIKTSLHRLKNMSSYGNCTPDEVFENIKMILKMLINYPMTLAEPSAYQGNHQSKILPTDAESRHQAFMEDGGTAIQQLAVPRGQNPCGLPSHTLGAANGAGNELPYSRVPSTCAPLNEETSGTSGRASSNFIKKVRGFLDSSSGDDNESSRGPKHTEDNTPGCNQSKVRPRYSNKSSHVPNQTSVPELQSVKASKPDTDILPSTSSVGNAAAFHAQFEKTELDRLINVTTLGKRPNQYAPASTWTYDSSNVEDPKQSVPSRRPLTRTASLNNASSSSDSSSGNDDTCRTPRALPISFEQSSVKEAKSPRRTKEQNYGRLSGHEDVINRSCSMGNDEAFINTKQVPHYPNSNASEHILPHNTDPTSLCTSGGTFSLPFSPNYPNSYTHETKQLPSISADEKLTGDPTRNTIYHECGDDGAQINGLNNDSCDHDPSTVRANSYFPSHSSNLSATLLGREEIFLNNNTENVANSYLQNKTSSYTVNGISQQISNPNDMENLPKQLSSQKMEEVKPANCSDCLSSLTKKTLPGLHPAPNFRNKNVQLSEKLNSANVHLQDMKHSTQNGETRMTELTNRQKQLPFPSQSMKNMESVGTSDLSSASTSQAFFDELSSRFVSSNADIQRSEKLVSVNENSWPTENDALTKSNIPPSLPIEQTQSTKLQEHGTSGKREKFSSLLNQMAQGSLQTPEDITGHNSNVFRPASSCSRVMAGNTPETVNNLPVRTSTNNVESPTFGNSTHSVRTREGCPFPKEDLALSPHAHVVMQSGEGDSLAENTDLSSSVKRLFVSVHKNDGHNMQDSCPSGSDNAATVSTKENKVKSPGRRVLAPSFSVSTSRKNHEEHGQTKTPIPNGQPTQSVQSFIADNDENKPGIFEREKTADLITDEDHSWKPTSAVSEFNFGFEDDVLKSPLVNHPETSSNLLNSTCPFDDDETIKLKDQLKQHYLKLEGLQGILNKYLQHRRNIRQPHQHNDDASAGFDLETRIHDAEILLRKKEEIWTTRSDERELAYEKEMLHANDNQVLSQYGLEMKRESLRNEISITKLKCKIFDLKIKKSGCGKFTQAH